MMFVPDNPGFDLRGYDGPEAKKKDEAKPADAKSEPPPPPKKKKG